MQLNAFKPIKPADPNDPAYLNFLKYLSDVNAFSSVADSKIYSWVDNPTIAESPYVSPFYSDGTLRATERITPLGGSVNFPNSRSAMAANQADIGYQAVEGLSPRGNLIVDNNIDSPKSVIRLRAGLDRQQANKTLGHEFDHALEAPQVRNIYNTSVKKGNKQFYFYDRKNKQVVPSKEFFDKSDMESFKEKYLRAAHEQRATASGAGDKTLAGTMAPEEQIIMPDRKYMQNPKLIQESVDAFRRFAGKGTKALGAIGSAIDVNSTRKLIDDVRKYGVQSNAPFQKYLGQDVREDMI
jgi:hypothetical protein